MADLLAPRAYRLYQAKHANYRADDQGLIYGVTDTADIAELMAQGCVANPYASPAAMSLTMPQKRKLYQAHHGVYVADRIGVVFGVSDATDYADLVAQGGVALTVATILAGIRTDVSLVALLSALTLPVFLPTTGQQGAKEVLIDTSTTYQTWVGAGFAVTESSAKLLMGMTSAARTAFLTEMVGPGGCNMVRLTMGDSDYAGARSSGSVANGGAGNTTSYTTYDDNGGTADPNLTNFSIAQDLVNVIPICQQILAINPNVIFMAAPWSPPAWLKAIVPPTNPVTAATLTSANSYFNNTSANLTTYANYFKNHFLAYKAQGINVSLYSLQNEPNFNPTGYPGCQWGAADFTAFIKVLGPIMVAAGQQQRFVSLGDANYDFPTISSALWTNALADATAQSYVNHAAFHGYGGDPTQISTVLGAYPAIPAMMTELSGAYYAPTDTSNFLRDWKTFMGNILIGCPRNGCTAFLWWNLLLDLNGMPGPAGTALGPVVSIDASGNLRRNVQYYELAQHTRYVRPGAKRVASTSFAAGTAGADLQSVAWLNTDGSVAVILWNNSTSAITATIKDQQSGGLYETVTLAVSDVQSFIFKNAAGVGVPDAPLIVAPYSGGSLAVGLAGAAPSSNGSPITGYDVFNSGTKVASNVALPYSLAVAASASYSVTVAARNAQGPSVASAAVAGTAPANALTIVQTASGTGTFTSTISAAFASAVNAASTVLAVYAGDQNVGTPTGATVLFANNDGGEFHKVFQLPASALTGGKSITCAAATAGQNTAYTIALYELQNLTSVAQESHGTGTVTNAPGHGRLFWNPTTAAQAAQVRIILASFNDGGAASITAPASGAIVDASNPGGLYNSAYYHAAIVARLPSAFASNPNVDSTVNMTSGKSAYTQLLVT